MSKDREINFVGQPILKQIFKLVENIDLSSIIARHQSDRYYKAFKTRTHLFTMLFGTFSRCDSMTEMAETKKAFSVVATLVRMNLISMLDVFELLRSRRRDFTSHINAPPERQLILKF